MATLVKVPARHFILEVDRNHGTTGAEDWTRVKGLTSFSNSPKTTDTDSTDYDSDGIAEHQTMERSREYSFSGFYMEDETTGDRDEGQAYIEALGEEIGPASVGAFRYTSPSGNRWSFEATVEVNSPGGGGNNDFASFSGKVSVTGPVTKTLATS